MTKEVSKRAELKRQAARFALSLAVVLLLVMTCLSVRTYAASVTVDLGAGEAGQSSGVLELFFLFALLALLPSILIMMTSFVRIIIVLSFLRNALGTQQSPPNQVMIGIALFLTLFIMNPVIQQINTNAYQPYQEGLIDRDTAIAEASIPIKEFMLSQTKDSELKLFLDISGQTDTLPEDADMEDLTELGFEVLVPAFMTSELKTAFAIGFYLFLPFLIIDIVVSSTLMSMGMVMLPPSMISLPFKIMMFVLVDGWSLLFSALVQGFYH